MRKYLFFFKINFLKFLEYRTDLFINLLLKLSVFVAFVFIWKSIYDGGNEITGYGIHGIVTYYLFSIVLHGLVTSQTARDLRDSIIRGTLSLNLAKPVNMFFYFLTNHFARVLSETIINAIFVLPIFIFFNNLFKELNLHPLNIIIFIVFSILASVLNFCLYYLIGLAAFWTKEASGLQITLRNSTRIFTGELIPIDILPAFLQRILYISPFPFLLFFPIKILISGYYEFNILKNILIVFLWITIILILCSILWRKGLQRYESVGI